MKPVKPADSFEDSLENTDDIEFIPSLNLTPLYEFQLLGIASSEFSETPNPNPLENKKISGTYHCVKLMEKLSGEKILFKLQESNNAGFEDLKRLIEMILISRKNGKIELLKNKPQANELSYMQLYLQENSDTPEHLAYAVKVFLYSRGSGHFEPSDMAKPILGFSTERFDSYFDWFLAYLTQEKNDNIFSENFSCILNSYNSKFINQAFERKDYIERYFTPTLNRDEIEARLRFFVYSYGMKSPKHDALQVALQINPKIREIMQSLRFAGQYPKLKKYLLAPEKQEKKSYQPSEREIRGIKKYFEDFGKENFIEAIEEICAEYLNPKKRKKSLYNIELLFTVGPETDFDEETYFDCYLKALSNSKLSVDDCYTKLVKLTNSGGHRKIFEGFLQEKQILIRLLQELDDKKASEFLTRLANATQMPHYPEETEQLRSIILESGKHHLVTDIPIKNKKNCERFIKDLKAWAGESDVEKQNEKLKRGRADRDEGEGERDELEAEHARKINKTDEPESQEKIFEKTVTNKSMAALIGSRSNNKKTEEIDLKHSMDTSEKSQLPLRHN